jgi:hypothetical protein
MNALNPRQQFSVLAYTLPLDSPAFLRVRLSARYSQSIWARTGVRLEIDYAGPRLSRALITSFTNSGMVSSSPNQNGSRTRRSLTADVFVSSPEPRP